MKVQLSWLQEYLEEELPSAEDLVERLSLQAFEVEGVKGKGKDAVIDVDILPNRGHDCLSHRGLAREISAIYGLTFKEREMNHSLGDESVIKVEVVETGLCRRYVATLVEGVKVEASPKWIKERLEALGERSINNIVDITNYVMFDTGQPLHAFDRDKLDGDTIYVRKAIPGEKMITLDGQELDFKGSELVIADRNSVLALAGVKGAKKAEVDANTKSIVLESASFDSVSVRKTSRRLDLITESSRRFENNASPEYALRSARFALNLIADSAFPSKGNKEKKFGFPVDVYPKPVTSWEVSLSMSEVKRVLGIEIPEEDARDILERLECEVGVKKGTLNVKPPIDRIDLVIPEDIIEELGRLYGYDSLRSRPLRSLDTTIPINRFFYYKAKIHSVLQELGFSEVYTYSIREKGKVELANPLTYDRKFLREEIGSDIKKALDFNERNIEVIGDDRVRVFEIANIFNEAGEERTHLAIGVRNVKKKQSPGEGHVIKSAVEKLSEELGGDIEGVGSSVHDGVWECCLDDIVDDLPDPESWDVHISKAPLGYKPISPYPFVLRDIAVFVPNGTTDTEVIDVIEDNAGELLARHRLFDVYEKKDEEGESWVSYAFRLVFLSHEKTLSDSGVNEIMERVTSALNGREGWRVR